MKAFWSFLKENEHNFFQENHRKNEKYYKDFNNFFNNSVDTNLSLYDMKKEIVDFLNANKSGDVYELGKSILIIMYSQYDSVNYEVTDSLFIAFNSSPEEKASLGAHPEILDLCFDSLRDTDEDVDKAIVKFKIENNFPKNIIMLSNLNKFNIENSILKFCKNIQNKELFDNIYNYINEAFTKDKILDLGGKNLYGFVGSDRGGNINDIFGAQQFEFVVLCDNKIVARFVYFILQLNANDEELFDVYSKFIEDYGYGTMIYSQPMLPGTNIPSGRKSIIPLHKMEILYKNLMGTIQKSLMIDLTPIKKYVI